MRYAFLSREWLAALHGVIEERVGAVQRLRPVSFSVAEVALRPPANIAPPGADAIAWSCRVTDGQVAFALEDDPEAEVRVVGDYDALNSLAAIETDLAGGAERMSERSEALIQAKRVTVFGSSAGRPAEIGSFHNVMARLTRAPT